MGHKQHGPQEIVAKLRQVGTLVGQGMLVTEAIRRIGVAEGTYYRWRAAHHAQGGQGDPDTEQAKRMLRLEVENTQPRRALADVILEKQALKEVVSGATQWV